MSRTIRLHLDENCSKAIARELRRHGIDVTTTPEAGLLGTTDLEQTYYALQSGRVIFTHDRDFLGIHEPGIPSHAGIAYCEQGAHSIGEIVSMLVLIWEVYEPEEMVGRIEFV